ncbi:endochitinase [Ganoderma leucocontextum]|nr:endochitinase [Ganoderma leucocontextum]
MHLDKLFSLIALPVLVVASPAPGSTQLASQVSRITGSSASPSNTSTKSSRGSSATSTTASSTDDATIATSLTSSISIVDTSSATTTSTSSTISTAAASPPPPAPSKNNTTGLVNGVLSVGWYTPKLSKYLPVADISWDKYSVIKFGSIPLTKDISAGVIGAQGPDVENLLKQLVKAAHANHVKVVLSIGGREGSQYFSSMMPQSGDDGASALVLSIHALSQEYDLDGFDFDWEFPGNTDDGLRCNQRNESDSGNFSFFLRAFRAKGGAVTVSATVGLAPFNSGEYGVPLIDVSLLFAEFLDYVTIMNYDVWTPASAVSSASARTAVEAWTKAGMPAGKILLGVPTYGHGYAVEPSDVIDASGKLAEYPAFDKDTHPQGDAWDVVPGPNATDICGNQTYATGNWYFHNLVNATNGFLDANGTAREGIPYRYDDCTQTPYAYNKTSGVMVSYDDVKSFEAKGMFVKAMKLGGFAVWEAAGDYNDLLLDAILDGVQSG